MAAAKNRRRLAYLAGPMEFTEGNEATTWREKITASLNEWGISCIDPVVEEKRACMISFKDMNKLKVQDLDKYRSIMRNTIIPMDLDFVVKADFLIVRHAGERTAGTAAEMTYAWQLKKPVILIAATDPVNIPGWCLGCATYVVDSIERAVDLARGL